jgi:hypothetical protein
MGRTVPGLDFLFGVIKLYLYVLLSPSCRNANGGSVCADVALADHTNAR